MKMLAARTVLAPAMWGTTYVTITELLPAEGPLLLAAARVAPAGLLLLVVARRAGWWAPRPRDWARTTVLALANFAIFFPLLTVAVERLPGGVAAAFGGLQPLFVAGLAWPTLGVRPTGGTVGVGLAAALGVALVVVGPGAGFDPVGVVAAVVANASFALGVVLTARFGSPRHHLAAAGWQLVVAAAVLVPLALAFEGPPSIPTATNLVGYVHLSAVATAGAFVLWFRGIGSLPVAAPPLLGLAAPVTGATLGWIVLGQGLSPVQLLGFLVTVAAIARGALLAASSESASAVVPASGSPHAAGEGSLSVSRRTIQARRLPDSVIVGRNACNGPVRRRRATSSGRADVDARDPSDQVPDPSLRCVPQGATP